MTALTNDSIWEIMGTQGYTAGDDIVIPAGASTTITSPPPGTVLRGQLHRVTVNATANAAVQMRSILSNDNPQVVVVVNDSTNAIVLFPFKAIGAGATDTAENINGGQGGFTVASNASAVLFASLAQTKRKGSGTANTLNWSAATFT